MRRLPQWMLCLSALAVATMTCQANVGDTLDQCAARYGKPTGHVAPKNGLKEGYIFQWKGLEISVIFSNDIVSGQTFKKIDQSAFSEKERDDIFQANSAGQKWSTPKKLPTDITSWTRSDGVHGSLLRKGRLIIFMAGSQQISEK